MEEMPHDKVPARLHEPRNVPRAIQPVTPIMASDSNEMTAIDDKMLAKPLTIESRLPPRVRDDDPTTLVVRDDERKLEAMARGSAPAPAERPSGKSKQLAVDLKVPPSSGHPRVEDIRSLDDAKYGTTGAGSGTSAQRQRASLILTVVIVALVAAAIGVFFGGMLRG
jgi:hypothetical protein